MQLNRKEVKQLFRKLSSVNPRELDDVVHDLHEKAFDKIDCLRCAKCCRILGPRVTDKDISVISGFLKIKPSKFTESYLKKDEDGDFIFKSMPCPFLGSDNYCSIYDFRPKACAEYPHTDRRRIYQLLPLTMKNIDYCPAVEEIVGKLAEIYK